MSAYTEGVLPLVNEYLRRRSHEVLGRSVWVETDPKMGNFLSDGRLRAALPQGTIRLLDVDNALDHLKEISR